MGHIGDGFYGSNEPTNSVKALKEPLMERAYMEHVSDSHNLCRWAKLFYTVFFGIYLSVEKVNCRGWVFEVECSERRTTLIWFSARGVGAWRRRDRRGRRQRPFRPAGGKDGAGATRLAAQGDDTWPWKGPRWQRRWVDGESFVSLTRLNAAECHFLSVPCQCLLKARKALQCVKYFTPVRCT